ncbi:ABC transporter ATP-binding protein [Phototrophicus methaneseepsis]|uniref:ABC transporter ATP-binding protein n=1 Tax=Phototrophicus methaneseepsis TaxID=2710758 RepID=A0A7S8EDC6_9CHLR|nr:ABC transporter ATP-binding protein [Phototrophicus methaneseepsis]QPC84895.1 ABC transporter ATP-binding protein [Phototrophicus methaneseepsis]
MNNAVISVQNITKDLKMGSQTVHILRGVSFEVYAGEMVSIVGPSGSGKSTLLGIIGGLDTATSGRLTIDGIDVTRMSEGKLTEIRNEKIGFIFQFFNLIPTLTAIENVALPIEFAKNRQYKPRKRARELLDLLGLGDRLNHLPTQLSGGQQQRVAIARALANNPAFILADEPTGNLDTESSDNVLRALQSIRRTANTTIILVTHDAELAERGDRVLTLVDGRIVNEKVNAVPYR